MKLAGMALVCALTLAMVFIGCEGSDSSGGGAAVNVSGVWNAVANGNSDSGTLSLSQSGSVVSGTYSSRSGYRGPLSGSVDGGSLSLVLRHSTGTATLDASVTGNAISGSYESSSGESGTFTGSRR